MHLAAQDNPKASTKICQEYSAFLSSDLFRIRQYLRAERVHHDCRCGFYPGASQAPELQWIGVVPCLADSPPMSFALLKSAASAAKVGHSVRPPHTFSSFLITGEKFCVYTPERTFNRTQVTGHSITPSDGQRPSHHGLLRQRRPTSHPSTPR